MNAVADAVPKRILVVDDDKYLRDFYSCILKSLGHVPVCAPNGAEGIKILSVRDDHYDLAVIDLLMPIKTGWEVIDSIRTSDHLRDLKVMAMTGLPLSVDEYEKIKRVTDAVFLKSDFELAKFSAVIGNLLEPNKKPPMSFEVTDDEDEDNDTHDV